MSEIVFPSPESELLGSKPPDTINALIEAVSGGDLFAGVLVRYGLLADLPRERERVYFLGASDYERVPWSDGHRVRREAYDIRGLVEVHKLDTKGPELAIGRSWQLLDGIDATLVEDPDLVSAEYTFELRVIADEVVPMSDGWLARIIFRLGMETSR